MTTSKSKDKAQYEPPTSQQDLAARQEEGWTPSTVVAGDNSVSPLDSAGFVGVDPVYQNAANEYDRPMQATEGPEAVLFERDGQADNVWEGDEAVPDVPTHEERVAQAKEDRKAEAEQAAADSTDEGDKGEGRGTGSPSTPPTPTPPTQ